MTKPSEESLKTAREIVDRWNYDLRDEWWTSYKSFSTLILSIAAALEANTPRVPSEEEITIAAAKAPVEYTNEFEIGARWAIARMTTGDKDAE